MNPINQVSVVVTAVLQLLLVVVLVRVLDPAPMGSC
jgi:hypothetical protein